MAPEIGSIRDWYFRVATMSCSLHSNEPNSHTVKNGETSLRTLHFALDFGFGATAANAIATAEASLHEGVKSLNARYTVGQSAYVR